VAEVINLQHVREQARKERRTDGETVG
jgi:hypothetical protein